MAKKERKYIKIRGASEHNLKCVSLDIPRDEFVVFTGLSGSGKSSLAFDTIYAEGQRRYMEVISYMFLSATVTASDDGLSLCPLQLVHGVMRINCSYSAFAVSEKVSLYRRSTLSTRPFHTRS